MNAKVFVSSNANGISRAELDASGQWTVTQVHSGIQVNCVTADLHKSDIVYAGTQGNGILRSTDGGRTWHSSGMEGHVVKTIAVTRAAEGVIYAGTKPPAIFVSRDGGQSWTEKQSFRALRRWFWFTPAEPGDPYVMGLAISPVDPNVVVAGVELGGVFRSADGGETWCGHLKRTIRDCHELNFHPTHGDWVYQAGGGWPVSVSSDSGITWSQPRRGMRWSLYGMACAGDPFDPSLWYASTAPVVILPQINKMPRGHWPGEANAYIFRKRGTAQWERLSGGLPQPLDHMAYALVTDPNAPGHLYAGLSNGDIWHTADYGDHWQQLSVNLGAIWRSMIILQ